jgi:hypothetical protein
MLSTALPQSRVVSAITTELLSIQPTLLPDPACSSGSAETVWHWDLLSMGAATKATLVGCAVLLLLTLTGVNAVASSSGPATTGAGSNTASGLDNAIGDDTGDTTGYESSSDSTGSAQAQALFDAAQSLDLNTIKRLIETQNVDVNSKDSSGQTPLLIAMQASTVYWHPFSQPQYDVIKYLLAHGADPTIPFPDYAGVKGYTVLHFAAYDGNMALVPLIVAAKANVNAKDSRGFTSLHSAARCDFRLSCDDCTQGSSVQDTWKQGALPTIKYLQAHGGDIAAKTNSGQTVLDVIAESKDNCPKTYAYVQSQLSGGKKG